MLKLKKHIDSQLESNQGCNLFHKDLSRIQKCNQSILHAIQNHQLAENDISFLIDYTTEKVLQEFYRVNQYFSFSDSDVLILKKLYGNLYHTICKNKIPANTIFNHHFENLKHWLEESNSFSYKMYELHGILLESVACFEYSSELQKNILCLNKIPLTEPILDIGCGQHGSLVKSFINNNLDVHGIDRVSNNSPHCEKDDWLTYHYGNKKWGTIVSNLGFSNHFAHHHLRSDGNVHQYAKTFMAILQSLKIGGSFCYAPDLPFIEIYLDKSQLRVTKQEIENMPFQTTIITQLK